MAVLLLRVRFFSRLSARYAGVRTCLQLRSVMPERSELWSRARPALYTQLQDYTVLVLCLISRVGLLSPPRAHEAGAGRSWVRVQPRCSFSPTL